VEAAAVVTAAVTAVVVAVMMKIDDAIISN